MGLRGRSPRLHRSLTVPAVPDYSARDHSVWDVVRVPFPYTNRPVEQRRPALVIAVSPAGDGPALLWLLMITSAANRPWSGDVPILDGTRAGLRAASVIRTAKIATIEASDALPLGRLVAGECGGVARALRSALAAALGERPADSP